MEFHIMTLLDGEWDSCDYCNTMAKAIKEIEWYEEMDKENKEQHEYAIMVSDNDRREYYMIYDVELLSSNNIEDND